MNSKLKILSFFAFAVILIFSGCAEDGEQGPEGPPGEQGPEGPVGPAGEDGSFIYAGEGTPLSDTGAIGDYYLNQNTGELYGPKDADGWGEPIIVLMGENGQDGSDGEDGSQIFSGAGSPEASMGVEGDYYLDRDNYELYGPKTGSGWGTPLNLKGADGSANVTRYIFAGHDFSTTSSTQRLLFGVENGDESLWLTYLVADSWKYFIPGHGPNGNSEYRVQHAVSTSNTFDLRMRLQSGPGENFDNIYVIRIDPGITEDHSRQAAKGSIIPDHLDVSDYKAVAEYFGLE